MRIRKISFKKFFAISASSIAATAMITSLATSCASENVVYEFEGKKFNSKKDIENYAKSNLTTQVEKDSNNNNYWLINNNGISEKFNDPYYLKQLIQSGIQTIPVSSSLNVNKYVNNTTDSIGAIPNTLVGKLLSNTESKIDTNNDLVNIYRGRNNKYYYNMQEAKQSYLNIHNAYCFNSVYFSNKEALNVYLKNNYDESKSSFNFIDSQYKALKAPNGFTSQPLKYSSDTNQNNTNKALKQDVKDFVENNAKKIYGIKDSEGIYEFTNSNSYYELSKKLTIENTDPLVMYSNSGVGSYIVDTNISDEYNFYGPYFYKGSADILKIVDKNLWKEVGQSDRNILTKNRENSLIQGFFGMLVKDIQTSETIFGIKELENETNAYSSFMKTYYPSIWNNILETQQTLEMGKRYNSFLKIPVMYTYIVEQLVLKGINNIAITKTRNYFKKICNYYDLVTRSMIPDKFLKPTDKTVDNETVGDDGLLSFSKLFGFDIKGFNYNSDINYYMDKIKLHYKNIISLASVAMLGYQNGSILNGAIKFNPSFIASQVKNYDFSLNKYYEYVWDIFSCNNSDKLQEFYNKNQDIIKFTFDEFNSLILGYVKRNFIFYQSLQINYQDQLKTYLNDKSQKKSLSMFKDVNNLDWLLSRVGNSFPLFAIFRNLNDFSLQGGYKYNTNHRYYIKSDLSSNTLLNSLKKIDVTLVKNSFNYQDFVIPGLEENFKLAFSRIDLSVSSESELVLNGLKSSNQFINESISNKIFDLKEKASNLIEKIKGLYDDIDAIKKVSKNLIKKGSEFLKKFGVSLSKVLKMVSTLVTFFKVASFVTDCVQFLIEAFVPKYEPKSYIYESNGTQYVWDGGLKSSVFFGLVETNVRTISEMKIIDPIKLNEPRARNFYYLNGKHFTPTLENETYLREYAKALSNNEVESNNIKLLYSFDNTKYNPSKIIPEELKESKEELSNHVFKTVFSDKNSDESKYTNSEIIYKYANGKTAISTAYDSKDMLIQNLVDSIKPTKIAMLPNLDNYNYPLKRDDELLDESINNYVLPGTSYDMKTGKEISYESKDKSAKFKYIIVDPNQEKVKNKSDTLLEIDSEKELINRFMDSFSVESKIVYKRETIGNDYFTNFSFQPNLFNLYKAANEIGENKYFLSIENAFQWLLNNYQYKKITGNKEVIYYVYNGKEKFYSMDDFYKWISKNTVEVRG